MAEIAVDGGKLIYILFARLFKYFVFDLVEEVQNNYIKSNGYNNSVFIVI